MACLEIKVENKVAPHLDINATNNKIYRINLTAAHICGTNTDGDKQLMASDGALWTSDNNIIFCKVN